MKLIKKVGVWVEGARPKTIPAAIVPVLVGTSSVETDFNLLRFLLALVVLSLIHISEPTRPY